MNETITKREFPRFKNSVINYHALKRQCELGEYGTTVEMVSAITGQTLATVKSLGDRFEVTVNDRKVMR
jgi:ABC-type molybdate transport system permease subunit